MPTPITFLTHKHVRREDTDYKPVSYFDYVDNESRITLRLYFLNKASENTICGEFDEAIKDAQIDDMKYDYWEIKALERWFMVCGGRSDGGMRTFTFNLSKGELTPGKICRAATIAAFSVYSGAVNEDADEYCGAMAERVYAIIEEAYRLHLALYKGN